MFFGGYSVGDLRLGHYLSCFQQCELPCVKQINFQFVYHLQVVCNFYLTRLVALHTVLPEAIFISLCYVASMHTKISTCSSFLHSCGLQSQARKFRHEPPELLSIEANTIAPCFLRHWELHVTKNHAQPSVHSLR